MEAAAHADMPVLDREVQGSCEMAVQDKDASQFVVKHCMVTRRSQAPSCFWHGLSRFCFPLSGAGHLSGNRE